MSPDQALSKKELLKELGVTDRLLKFWVSWYKLPVNRRGRGSTYPAQTVEKLKLIKRLADSRYFTMRFVRDLLQASQPGGDHSALDSHLSYCRSILARPSSASSPSYSSAPVRPVMPVKSPDAPRPFAAPVQAVKRMGTDLL